MTALYEWNPMPHNLDVKCARCGQRAYFEFAEIVKIKEKKDLPFFQNSDQFEYLLCQDSCGHKWHAALFFAGLHGRTTTSIRDLPPEYKATDWEHSRYLSERKNFPLGSVDCSQCGLRQIITLNWPQDAYFQIEYKGQTLWAYHEESALELIEFITAKARNRMQFQWHLFLLHVPAIFLTEKARNETLKKLKRLLQH